MRLILKDKFFKLFSPNNVERIETRQIKIQPVTTIAQEHSINDSALLLTFRLSQFLRILPICIKKRNSNTYYITISPVIYVINILICLFINGVVMYGLFLPFSKENHQLTKSTHTTYKDKGNYMMVLFSISLVVLHILYTLHGMIRVRRILDCLECIKKIKQSISNDSNECLGNRRKMCSIILFLTFSQPFLYFTAIGFIGKFSDFCSSMSTILSASVVLFDVIFFLLVESLNSSFEEINKQLKKILSHLNFYYIKRTHRKNISLQIGHLMLSFVKSCNMLKKINSNESLLLFFHVILYPLYILFSWYYFGHALLNIGDDFSTLTSVCLKAFNCFYNLFVLCFIIQPCHQTQKKVNDTKHLVAEIMCHIQSEDDPLFNSVDTFYKQLLLNQYSFTVMGFCEIEIPLITKILGLAFTLLTVIKF